MTTSVYAPATGPTAELRELHAEWERLAELVQAYDPTVIVLVARKPARMLQALRLELGPGALVISDLAIPFSGAALAGARVAIVDDVVNVGSTIRRAVERCRAAGVLEAQAFAISHLEHDGTIDGLEVSYSGTEILDHGALRAFAARIPAALQYLSKPYDLDFPLVPSVFQAPFRDFAELLAALRERHGHDHVYDLSNELGARRGFHRCAIDLNEAHGRHRKIRLYVDESAGICNVVPFSIPAVLSPEPPAESCAWASGLFEHLAAATHDRDALCRLRLFADSLTLAEDFLGEHTDLLIPLGADRPFDLEDAQLVLGPLVHTAAPGAPREPASGDPADREIAPSPFLAAARERGLVAAIAEGAEPGRDAITGFLSCFRTLAKWVGAGSPDEYRLGWPYSASDVAHDPYKRLRIGPTIADLVAILQEVTGEPDAEVTRRQVTRLLDRFIDAGGVVPTTAEYDGQIYRIYRKGETRLRDRISERTKYAWANYNKPLSLTRASKLLAILAFDGVAPDSGVHVAPDRRGNTIAFEPSVLDAETEITHYLRNTGQLKAASSDNP